MCSEQLVNRLFAYVDPLALNSDATATREDDELVFRVVPRNETIGVQWMIDDVEVGTGPELRLNADITPDSWARLTARVHDASGYVVGDLPSTATELEWWVRR